MFTSFRGKERKKGKWKVGKRMLQTNDDEVKKKTSDSSYKDIEDL